MKNILFACIIFISATFTSEEVTDTNWKFNRDRSRLGFSVSRVILRPVTGQVKTFTVLLDSQQKDFTDATVELTAEVNSLTTGSANKDTDLKSANFFDAPKYPFIKFRSHSFRKIDQNKYRVTGELTMHGITKTIIFDAIYSEGKSAAKGIETAIFKINYKLDRFDFKIGKGTNSSLVSKDVTVSGELEFSRKVATVE